MTNIHHIGKGALPIQSLLELVENGFITADESTIKPSSIDLVLEDNIYEVPGVFQVEPGKNVLDMVKSFGQGVHPFSGGMLQKGKTYLIPISNKIDLPKSIYGYANPKSTSGRLDMHVRLLADKVPWYDFVPKSFGGKLWILVSPKTFSIQLNGKTSLNQLRLFNSDTRLMSEELEQVMQKDGLLFFPQNGELFKSKIRYKDLKVRDDDRSLLLSLDLQSKIVGYRAKENINPIEYNCNEKYLYSDFFEVIEKPKGNFLKLDSKSFYILSSLENVMVPPDLACEMAPMDDRLGDFRSHYAGFIDPGWGYGKAGEEQGRQLTLEVRVFEDMLVKHNQPIARIKFERLIATPDVQYDQIASNYTQQIGPKLAKQFKV